MTVPLAPYRVKAFNTAHDSENKIHDDATAKRFGFGGGLVPGVDVYGYMSHMPVMRWGRAWLERGSAECRFLKPVYDGDEATVTATETADWLEIAVESRGELCATGRASLLATAPQVPGLGDFRLCRSVRSGRRPMKPRWRSGPGSASIPTRSRRRWRRATWRSRRRARRFTPRSD